MNFTEFITEQKNTHMTHIEDKVLYGGVKGTREAIFALRSLRDMLGGTHEGKISVKWDGAPAIFAGIDPRDGKFFVAKKGIFNKSPKVYKSDSDIDSDTSGDLSVKLKLALKHFPSLGIKGVVQGDLLFTKGDVKTETIKGSKYVTFHPNTLVYAVPADTDMATDIKNAEIGVVWHTEYIGNSFETMRASYGVNVAEFNKSTKVWSQDAILRDMTKLTLSKEDTDEVNSYLSTAGKIFNSIAATTLKELESNPALAQTIEQYNNVHVRRGEVISNTTAHVNGLIRFITSRHEAEINKAKTAKGKDTRTLKMKQELKFFSTTNKKNLKLMFDLQKVIVLAKLKLINILSRLSQNKTFLKTKRGFRVTGQEGYVAIDTLGGDAVKIVDRMEFSFANFNPSILKGWDKPTRT